MIREPYGYLGKEPSRQKLKHTWVESSIKEASMLSPVSEGQVGEGGTEINVFPFRGEQLGRSREGTQEHLQSSGDHSGWD